MATISVYLNSRASQSKGSYIGDDFKKYLFRHQVNVYSPDTLEDLKSIIENDIQNNTDYIFSVGGDGTANLLSQYLIGTNIKLMVVPAGTANDLANEIGISSGLKKIAKVFQANTTKKIDAIQINNKYMVTNGGIGLACNVANRINKYRKLAPTFKSVMKFAGNKIYAAMFAKEILSESLDMREYFFESPDLPVLNPIIRSSLILINNQSTLGGTFRIAPLTKNNDGKFNVTILLHENKYELVKDALPLIMGGEFKTTKNIISFETDKLTINAIDGQPIKYFGDGEILGEDTIVEVSLIPKSLEVCTYKGESLICSGLPLDNIELIQ